MRIAIIDGQGGGIGDIIENSPELPEHIDLLALAPTRWQLR